jgi:hypothetical protein
LQASLPCSAAQQQQQHMHKVKRMLELLEALQLLNELLRS